MSRISILKQASDEAQSLQEALRQCPELEWEFVECDDLETLDLAENSTVFAWLSDEWLSRSILTIRDRQWTIAILPHPDLRQARIGLGIASKVEEALFDFRGGQEAIAIDLLLCNDRPVLNSVWVGESANLLVGMDHTASLRTRILAFWKELARVGQFPLTPCKLATEKNQPLATAMAGMVVVLHQRNSLFAGELNDHSSVQDGMLHALVLAPQSWFDMFWFLIRRLLLQRTLKERMADFVGRIKTKRLEFESPREVPVVIDGVKEQVAKLTFRVEPAALRIVPGRHLKLGDNDGADKEVYRVSGLPRGELRDALIKRPLYFFRHADTEEFKELYSILRENARTSPSFLTLMVVSSLIAACGLFADSSPVIIGAMILAPLMGPIVSMAMGVARQERSLTLQSLRTVAIGVMLALTCAAALSTLLPLPLLTDEIAARVSPNLLDLAIAVLSGVAGAYAHARQEVARSLAGVSIAVALVPPVVVAGIGLGWHDLSVFGGASLLFLANFVGILFAGSITFSILGFAPLQRARLGMIASLCMVALVSVPLAISFREVMQTQRTVKVLNGLRIGDLELHDVRIRHVGELPIVHAQVHAARFLTPEDYQACGRAVREHFGDSVKVELVPVLRVE